MKSANYRATAQHLAKSWWILLTLPLGFLSWAAFLYVGARVKHRRWILYGILYLIPFGVYAVTDEIFSSSSWQLNAVIWIYIVAWVALHGSVEED